MLIEIKDPIYMIEGEDVTLRIDKLTVKLPAPHRLFIDVVGDNLVRALLKGSNQITLVDPRNDQKVTYYYDNVRVIQVMTHHYSDLDRYTIELSITRMVITREFK